MALNLIPKRKIVSKKNSDTVEQTLKTLVTTERVDERNLGFFDYRLRIPCGVDKYDS
jgi:hypothetical protein